MQISTWHRLRNQRKKLVDEVTTSQASNREFTLYWDSTKKISLTVLLGKRWAREQWGYFWKEQELVETAECW